MKALVLTKQGSPEQALEVRDWPDPAAGQGQGLIDGRAVVLMASVRAGETVLVHAAAGGVGIAALQLLRDRGAVTIGTASASKHDAVRAQGAAHVIDYRSQDVKQEVDRITGGKGVDVILDALGEFRRSYSM